MRPFSWRRELWWMLIPAAVALLVRVPAVPHAEALWNADGAITALMAKHHWRGELPVFFYGQDYNGSLEPLMAAPFYGWYGASLRGVALSKTICFALAALAIFRVSFEIGGRGAALAGSLPFALGTWPLMASLARQNSYLAMLVLGCAITLVALPLIERPTGRRACGLGLLVGLAWFNNPQIASFLVPPLLLLMLRGELPRRLREHGPAGLHPKLRLLQVGLLLWAAGAALLDFAGGYEGRPLGIKISLTHPQKYLVRAFGALAVCVVALQFWCSTERERWLRVGGLFGLGFLVGDAGGLWFKLFVPHDHVRKLSTALDPAMAPTHWRDFKEDSLELLFNRASELEGQAVPPGFEWLAWPMMALVAAGAAGWLWLHRRELWQLCCLRPAPASAGLLLGLQVIGLAALYLMHPHPFVYPRYLLAWWVAYCALFAGIFAVLERRVGRLAWLVAALWIAWFAGCALRSQRGLERLDAIRPGYPPYRELIAEIERRRITRGYANYWYAFPMIYLTDERLILRTWPEIQDPVHPPYVDAVNRAERHVWVFRTGVPDDQRMLDRFEREMLPRLDVTEKLRRGDWLLYFTKR